MEINEPIRLDDELLFCEECNRLALAFLNEAREAVRQAGVSEASDLRTNVDLALAAFLERRASCAHCNED